VSFAVKYIVRVIVNRNIRDFIEQMTFTHFIPFEENSIISLPIDPITLQLIPPPPKTERELIKGRLDEVWPQW